MLTNFEFSSLPLQFLLSQEAYFSKELRGLFCFALQHTRDSYKAVLVMKTMLLMKPDQSYDVPVLKALGCPLDTWFTCVKYVKHLTCQKGEGAPWFVTFAPALFMSRGGPSIKKG
jgi:hypothetical protein